MKIVAPIKLVPDLVEELEFLPDASGLDLTSSRLMLNELDDHAIEQAILLKEESGGEVTVMGPDMEGVDDALFAAAAKGADHIIKLCGDYGSGINNHALARMYAKEIEEIAPDLVLTGVQAHDNLDGAMGPLLAALLGMPYVGYVAGVNLKPTGCTVRKEYPGGVVGVMNVQLPALLGIQAAEEPPRYLAISKVRQAMKRVSIEERAAGPLDASGAPEITRMYAPETAERAEMLSGDEGEIADQIIELLRERGYV
jgi:electron transfer flavoprotein beta subunit